MLGFPWWSWVVLLVLGVLVLLLRASRAWRASIRRELIEFLRREAPDLEVVAERDRELEVRAAGGTGTLRLDRLFAEGARIRTGDSDGKEALFAQFVKMMRESGNAAALDPEHDRRRVLPRVVRDGFVTRLQAEVEGQSVPALPSGVPGLSVVLVLDSESSVAYVTEAHLADLQLTPVEALAQARANLSRRFDGQVVRSALDGGSIHVVKSGDTFDAARVLLVAEYLQEGEEVAALIPDRDTLVLTGVPADGDWSPLRKLAKTAAGEPLWPEPLLVSRVGIVPATGK